MDKLLHAVELVGGSAHADDVRAISTSTNGAVEQSLIISDFTNKMLLNQTKTEVLTFSCNSNTCDESIQIVDSSVPVLSQAKCLGYQWSRTLLPKLAVEENIKKARKQFFALGASGCFLRTSSPLSAKSMFENCVRPTLLYGAENWILSDSTLALLETFQAEIGRRILKVSKYHSKISTNIGLRHESQDTQHQAGFFKSTSYS